MIPARELRKWRRWAEEGDRVSFIVTEDPASRDLAGYLGRMTYEPEPA